MVSAGENISEVRLGRKRGRFFLGGEWVSGFRFQSFRFQSFRFQVGGMSIVSMPKNVDRFDWLTPLCGIPALFQVWANGANIVGFVMRISTRRRGGVYPNATRCCQEHFQTAYAPDVPPVRGWFEIICSFSIILSPLRDECVLKYFGFIFELPSTGNSDLPLYFVPAALRAGFRIIWLPIFSP